MCGGGRKLSELTVFWDGAGGGTEGRKVGGWFGSCWRLLCQLVHTAERGANDGNATAQQRRDASQGSWDGSCTITHQVAPLPASCDPVAVPAAPSPAKGIAEAASPSAFEFQKTDVHVTIASKDVGMLRTLLCPYSLYHTMLCFSRAHEGRVSCGVASLSGETTVFWYPVFCVWFWGVGEGGAGR